MTLASGKRKKWGAGQNNLGEGDVFRGNINLFYFK